MPRRPGPRRVSQSARADRAAPKSSGGSRSAWSLRSWQSAILSLRSKNASLIDAENPARYRARQLFSRTMIPMAQRLKATLIKDRMAFREREACSVGPGGTPDGWPRAKSNSGSRRCLCCSCPRGGLSRPLTFRLASRQASAEIALGTGTLHAEFVLNGRRSALKANAEVPPRFVS